MTFLLKPWLKSCVNENSIDWQCRYPLTHTGAIDEQKACDMGLLITSSIRPMPVVSTESNQYQQLLAATHHARVMVNPATSAEAGFELKRLSVWCPMGNREKCDYKLMLCDALSDLAGYPLDLIQQACSRYRNDSDPRNDFFPRPGRLKNFVEHKLAERKRLLYRLERLLATANQPPELPPVLTLEELEHQATHRLKLEKMLKALGDEEVEELCLPQIRERLAMCTEQLIYDAQTSKHITPLEAGTLLQSLHSRYHDIFQTTKNGDPHDPKN